MKIKDMVVGNHYCTNAGSRVLFVGTERVSQDRRRSTLARVHLLATETGQIYHTQPQEGYLIRPRDIRGTWEDEQARLREQEAQSKAEAERQDGLQSRFLEACKILHPIAHGKDIPVGLDFPYPFERHPRSSEVKVPLECLEKLADFVKEAEGGGLDFDEGGGGRPILNALIAAVRDVIRLKDNVDSKDFFYAMDELISSMRHMDEYL